MAIFNKLGELAKNVSDKTDNMLEISKLNSEIRNAQDDIEELTLKLGNYMWLKYKSGIIMDEQATAICKEIQSAQDKISARQADINSIKRAKPAPAPKEHSLNVSQVKAQMRAHSKEILNEFTIAAESASTPVSSCPLCGSAAQGGSRFCGNCGTKLY